MPGGALGMFVHHSDFNRDWVAGTARIRGVVCRRAL
jgi:hypothetical protein